MSTHNSSYNTPSLEKRWKTFSSLEAIVLIHPTLQHRCGYVGVSKNHGLFDITYEEVEAHIVVHGGLTFSGELPLDVDPERLYWFGYDCAHSFDKSRFNPGGQERSLDYCISECEKLSSQLNDTPISLFYLAKKLGTLTTEQHNRMLAWGIEIPQDDFVKKYFELVGARNV